MYLTVVVWLVLAASAEKTKTTSVRKCCPQDFIFDQGKCSGSNETFVLPQIHTWPGLRPSNESVPKLSYGFPVCNTFMYYLDPYEDPSEKFTLLDTGWLVRGDGRKDPPGQYCFDVIAHENGVRPVVCFLGDDEEPEDAEAKGMFAVYPVGMLVSIPFLLVTFFVYAIFKQLRSLHGYCLMSHVAALIASYSSLIVVQIASSTMDIQFCILLGFAVQFFFLATFFWLNVMCIDIYWAFSGIKLRGTASERDRKKLLAYSFYAWGMPLIILAVTVGVDYSDSIPSSSIFKPNMGKDRCFFKGRTATWTYFYGPMAVILFSNLILFSITAYRIWRHRRETAQSFHRGDSRRHDGNESERFNLYLKLFLVMGINWISELISFMFGKDVPQYLWYITDITNTLQGVFIFLIFVWKKRVRKLLWEKLCGGKQSQLRSSTMTTSTALNSSTR
ncbi:G-protein coupled receptor Mth2-like isoform X1 [Cimex lectularius]|uniref:G-protein coupled receptors family 2 profile 2 domain-containing protein n=1 Tax=Cimex lectularius TaxID=79782 RepID=A0A8I6RZG9_CIMLE|nr:G-protein coupled receptor Mth2-like isoform X1 [Cimex lectularius]